MILDGILVGWAVMPESRSKVDPMRMHQIKVINGMLHKDLNSKKVQVWHGIPTQS
jgi:hypothetical protein